MKAEKLKSGKYRARAYHYTDKEGKKHYKSFTSESKKEAERIAILFEDKKKYLKKAKHITLGEAADLYIDEVRRSGSPATVYGYEKIRKSSFHDLFLIYIDKLTNEMLVNAVNEEMAKGISPKTIKNRYGFVCSVLKEYVPDLDRTVKLPQVAEKIPVLPEPDDVIRAVKGTDVELPVLLAMWLSFSLSEIKGLKKSSINGDYIQVDQVVVYAGKNVEKSNGKVDTRIRKHRLPPYIKELIDKIPDNQEYLVPEWGSTINNRLRKALEANGLPVITLHKCRHLFASLSLVKLGISSEIVKQEGGWRNEKTMRKVYTHSFNSDRVDADKKIDDYFNDVLESENVMSYKTFLERLNLNENPESKKLYDNYIKLL